MHISCDKFVDIKLCHDIKTFHTLVEDDRFFNLIRINEDTALIVLDGQNIVCNNPIYVPAR